MQSSMNGHEMMKTKYIPLNKKGLMVIKQTVELGLYGSWKDVHTTGYIDF